MMESGALLCGSKRIATVTGLGRTLAGVARGNPLLAAQLEVVQRVLADQVQLVDWLVRLCTRSLRSVMPDPVNIHRLFDIL